MQPILHVGQPVLRLTLAMLSLVALCGLASAQLPANDANKYQIIVVGSPTKAPATWFSEVADLAKLKQATSFTLLRPKANAQDRDGLFETRYQATLGTDFPIVAYLRPDGGVIYFADRHSMPTRDKLYDAIKEAHLMAKKALPAATTAVSKDDLFSQTQSSGDSDWQDCIDGNCTPPLDERPATGPRFPKLHPFQTPTKPGDNLFGGFFSDAIGSGIWLVFSIVALGFVFLFMVLIVGAMMVVAKIW